MYSGPKCIMEGEAFALDSYGNGAAYTLRNLAGRSSVWLQGDDARDFRNALENYEAKHPLANPDRVLSWLWDQCDYGAAAQPDDE